MGCRQLIWAVLIVVFLGACSSETELEESLNQLEQSDENNQGQVESKSSDFIDEKIEGYPTFSWDYVPTHAHFHIEGSANFTEQQAEFLANTYDFITLEKQHGDKTNIGTDVEIYTAATMLKKYNPDMMVVMYRSGSDYGKWLSTGSIFNRPEYEYLMRWNEDHTEYVEGFDYRIEAAREYMKESVAYYCRLGMIDGMYMDSYGSWNDDSGSSYVLLGAEEYNYLRECAFQMFREFVAENPGTITIGNSVSSRNISVVEDEIVMDAVSGGMIDHFANYNCADAASIAKDIELMLHIAKKKKICIAKGWPRYDTSNGTSQLTAQEKEAAAKEDIVFPLACYLMGASDYSYFCYGWQWDMSAGWLVDYPEYHKPLGKPLGDYRTEGYNYYRDFEHASAWANIETGEAEIIWDIDN